MPALDLPADALIWLVTAAEFALGIPLCLWIAWRLGIVSEPVRFLVSDLPGFAEEITDARIMNEETV